MDRSPRFGIGVPIIIIVAFVGLMMTYRASDSGTRHSVMARCVAHDAADKRSFDAAGSKGRRAGCPGEGRSSDKNQNMFHDAPTFQLLLNVCAGGAFRPAWFRCECRASGDRFSEPSAQADHRPKR